MGSTRKGLYIAMKVTSSLASNAHRTSLIDLRHKLLPQRPLLRQLYRPA